MAYSLVPDGEAYEQSYYFKFIRSEFPSYETFWAKCVVPLTNRPTSIHFKTDTQLAAIGRGPHDICVAQLHYTILRHLAKVYEIRHLAQISIDDLINGMIRLSGAQDVAFEFLERYGNPGIYDPWLARVSGGRKGSKEARQAWQKKNGCPLQNIRDYRNHLVHGRISPTVIVHGASYVPAIGKEDTYFDWRLVTQHSDPLSLIGTDLVTPKEILDDAWKQTLDYFEAQWRTHLP